MPRIYLSPPDIRPEDYPAVKAVFDSNWVAPVGPDLAAFEGALCTHTGCQAAVALNSGTAALHMALQLLNIGPGDTVICPTLTFAASANPICYCGAEPVFVDSESDTWNMDPTLLREALADLSTQGKKPKAVIVVHIYGQCADMDEIMAICTEYEVPIIEDAAEALGADFRGQAAGSFGAFSFFSFNGNKIITTSGGGMLVSNNREAIQRARYLATQARQPVAHYEHTEIGFNYRLSNVLAGLGLSQFNDLGRRIAQRKAHFSEYTNHLRELPGVEMMPISDQGNPNYWLTCLTLDRESIKASRDDVLAALEAEDIEARPLWKPLHLQPVYEDVLTYGGAVAEGLFEAGICLPSGSSLRAEERERVIENIIKVLSN
ncbi:MAG: aminotransferase class I/II-fold pyridoxal phosphate-dependent enzyme [Verrucomicrobiota bacterium]